MMGRPNKIALITISVFLLGVSEIAVPENIEDILISQVKELNRSLPKKVATNLRQETSLTTRNGIIHRYTALDRPHEVVAQRWPKQDQIVTRTNCSDPYIAEMLKRGVTFTFLYYGNDGQLGGKVEVTARKCGF